MKTNVVRIDEYNAALATQPNTRAKAIIHDWQQEDLARRLQQVRVENEQLMDYLFELTWRIKKLESDSKQ